MAWYSAPLSCGAPGAENDRRRTVRLVLVDATLIRAFVSRGDALAGRWNWTGVARPAQRLARRGSNPCAGGPW